ncbi:kinase-like domain-containing protein [Mycena capillaripes]|nr:kinase-like domain-containing protein [Mycena capillaripes]
MRVIRWLIITGPGRHESLRGADWAAFHTLIRAWGNAEDALAYSVIHICRLCENVSQWLDLWITTMLEIYSCDDLRSIPWRYACQCLERKLDVIHRESGHRELGRDCVVLSHVLYGLVVSPWPLILWVTFRLMEPTAADSFHLFLDIIRSSVTTGVFTWDGTDDAWLSHRLSAMSKSTTDPHGVAWFNLYPAKWRQYMMELDPPRWRLIHDMTWSRSDRQRRFAPELEMKLRLAAVFHTYSSTLSVLFAPIDILEPLGFGSYLSFFDALAPSELKIDGQLEPPRLPSDSQDIWTIPALQQWLREWEKQLCRVAWHTTPDASHVPLNRIECMLLLFRLKIPHNFIVYVFPFVLRHSERRLSQFREFVRRWEECDILTSLANYGSTVETLFSFLQNLHWPRGPWTSLDISKRIYILLSHDIATIFARLTLVLREPKSYKTFLSSRGILAQGLLDLLQELLDYNIFLAVKPLFFKALERLSRASGLHPKCFSLSGLQKLGNQVAAGGFGDIWKSSILGHIVAVKVMRLFDEEKVQTARKEFGREALIWRQLSHPNLLPFFGMFYLDKRLCLVAPWMENGNIVQFIAKFPSEIDRISLILDVAAGLNYLHDQKVVHGDLKGMNILITPSRRACIADFGLSSVVDAMSVKFTHSTANMECGTLRWQAPELLRGDRENHFGSDIYAFACVCYEIVTQKVPFHELYERAIPFKVASEGVRPSRPPSWPDTAAYNSIWGLLQDCWKEDPESRPTIQEIIQRLVEPPIQANPPQSAPDWDERLGSKFRRSLQDRHLLPSVTDIEGKIFLSGWSHHTQF